MKMWIQRTKIILHSPNGETLMESIASLFIFTLLMVAVTTMIQTSFKMTGIYAQEAKTAQEALNPVVLSEYATEGTTDITLTVTDIGVVATHRVIINTGSEVLAFAPEPDPDPGDEP